MSRSNLTWSVWYMYHLKTGSIHMIFSMTELSFKTCDLLKEVQFIWYFLWQDKKRLTFKYRWLLYRGDHMGRFDCISLFTIVFHIPIHNFWIKEISLFFVVYFEWEIGRSKNVPLGVVSGVNMNTFGVYLVHSKTHVLVLSAGFCIRVADWSIYNTFMLTHVSTLKGAFLDLPLVLVNNW